jgi:hypothetical protein
MEVNKIPNPVKQEDLHTTVLFSRNILDKAHHINVSKAQLEGREWRFSPLKFDIFGTDTAILVLRIDAPEIQFLHDQLINVGGTHDFPTYDPHITLSYNVPKNLDISKFGVPPIYLFPVSITTEKLKIS